MENYLNVVDGMIIDGNIDYDERIQKIYVSDEIYNLWKEDNRKVIYQNGEIIENPNYEEEKRQEYEQMWLSDFFQTSLGWIRRKVMVQATGETRDFLYDMKPNLTVGDAIITYDKPDFVTQFEPIQHRDKIVTEQFLQDCRIQIALDFYGAIPDGESPN